MLLHGVGKGSSSLSFLLVLSRKDDSLQSQCVFLTTHLLVLADPPPF